MQAFKLISRIHQFDTFKDFAKEFNLGEGDIIITNSFLYEPYMKDLNLNVPVIFQEKYGQGEPSDEMMNAMLEDIKKENFNRIIAVGGGTVVDIAKLFVLKDVNNVVDAFGKTIPIVKEKELIIIPTTCGTGSEVTNISIAEIKSKKTKMGLAVDEITADDAVLIPEFLEGLPYKFYLTSSIDALIHAVEGYVSPKASDFTKMFSKEAIRMILEIYMGIVEHGEDHRKEHFREMLLASNYAGIAFGNAGVGAVHALSYPLGGTYHVPHGEANYQFFTEVFNVYNEKNPNGAIKEVNELMAEIIGSTPENVYNDLDKLLGNLLEKNQLRSYGMKEEEIEGFADSVIATQQRLLGNNYVELSRDEIRDIYKRLY